MEVKDATRPRSRHYADLLDEMAEGRPDSPAVVHAGHRLTYSQIRTRAREVARGLLALGVRPGDRVALLMTNRLEWPVIAFGVFQIGATLVPLSSWYRAWDLDHVLRHCRAKVLISLESFRGNRYLDTLAELAPELAGETPERLRSERFPDLERVVGFQAERLPGWAVSYKTMLEAGGTVGDAELADSRAQTSPEDLCYILYTSGSTSAPKGVMVAHWGCLVNGFDIGERQHLTAADRLWLVVPLAWALGSQNGMSAILTHGGCMVLQEYMEPGEALRLLEAERVTAIYATPNIVHALLDHPDHPRTDLSRLRTGVSIGTPAEMRRAMIELAVPHICNVYGATETYGNCCVTDAADPPEVRASCQGRPLPSMEISVFDRETAREQEVGESGEIRVRGCIVPGYWNDPQNTAAAFQDGWYHTGDIGYFDAEHRIHFVGRIKEMIKTGGINVAPAEVEAFLTSLPQVKEAYVVGVPDQEKGEAVVAFVQLKAGVEAGEAALRDSCRASIASYKIPSRICIVDEVEVPRTSTGKVNKRELVKLLD